MSNRRNRDRRKPEVAGALDCRHFDTCGGCSSLDVPIAEQIARKRADVAYQLASFLPPDIDVHATTPKASPMQDRIKVQYPVAPAPDGSPRLGLYARGSHRLVEIEQCRVQHPVLTEFGRRAAAALRKLGVAAYDERANEPPPTPAIRALLARVAPGTGEILIGLTTTGGMFPNDLDRQLADALFVAASEAATRCRGDEHPVGVVRSILDGPSNALLGRQQVPLRGRDYQIDRVGKLEFRIGLSSFYQVHRNADALLYRPALAACGDLNGRTVVDAYAGIGTFAYRMLVHRGAAHVRILEEHPGACADAEATRVLNGISDDRVDIRCGPVPADPEAFASADVVLLDPPRRGLDEGVARAVIEARPARIVYVSCSLRSLARDLDHLLHDRSFEVRGVRVVDLFPHTEHVEVICSLHNRNSRRRRFNG